MCLPILGIALSVAGSFASAMMASAQAKQVAAIEANQLRTEIENEKIKAMGDTNDRLEQFRRDEASNAAAMSALGFDNQSYEQGIVPFNRRVVGRDVQSIDFNAGQQIGRKKYEIKVAGWRARSEGRAKLIEAGASSLATVGGHFMSGGSFSGSSTNARYGE